MHYKEISPNATTQASRPLLFPYMNLDREECGVTKFHDA
jgi:hypothetical protein